MSYLRGLGIMVVRQSLVVAVSLTLVLCLAACGSITTATPSTLLATQGNLRIEAAYIRPAPRIEVAPTMVPMDHPMPMDHAMPSVIPVNSSVGAAYLTVVNRGAEPDTLLGATTNVADAVELHETVQDGNFAKMEAQPEGVAVPAGGELRFAPGGYHMMLVGLKQSLTTGMQVQLSLNFAEAGTVQLTVPVQAGP